MGNCCLQGEKFAKLDSDSNDVESKNEVQKEGENATDARVGENSLVLQWEKKQKEMNEQVLNKLRQDFNNRPDNFILNLLVLSVQFYANFSKEKAEIIQHIRERELALENKLTSSRRKVMYLGGQEEISGTHILYQPKCQPYTELPTPLQIYVVQDNIDLYPEEQYQELQEKAYSVLDGPAYRFCTEYSNRHAGYVRLRCADIIPGVTRHNTYEDIYGYMKPTSESEPDPFVDSRPLRRNSVISTATDEEDEGNRLEDDRKHKEITASSRELSTEFEETDSDSDDSEMLPPSADVLNRRRPSGVMPHGYPHTQPQGSLLAALRQRELERAAERSTHTSRLNTNTARNTANAHTNGLTNAQTRSLTERRPSGAFPKVGPDMKRLKLASSVTMDGMAMLRQKLALVEEESEEESEEEREEDRQEEREIQIKRETLETETMKPESWKHADGPVDMQRERDALQTEALKHKNGSANDENEPHTQHKQTTQPSIPQQLGGMYDEADDTDDRESTATVLHAQINRACFLNRKIKIRQGRDAYGIQGRLENRTYLSSERYLECFEGEFEDLAAILGKRHLVDDCKTQVPAILASELMVEHAGPKYNIEFIPTLMLKEWPNCSFEWKLRERKTRVDEHTQMMYRWPKDHNIQEVVQMGCNLVPVGHYNPTQPNRVMKIEWQIQFTKAEQLLLKSLGHTQVRLLLLVEFLIRDHLHELPGLKIQHIRYILFWMCEHNFRDWEEDRLGNKLKAFFKTLYNCLSTENLPHYFIDKCNLMENIPERYLRQIQASVKKMKENLPIYLMHTMRRMRTASNFYETLDIEKLYNLVTAKHFGIEDLNPQLLNLVEDNTVQNLDLGEDVLYSDSEDEREAEIKRRLHEERKKRKKRAQKTNKNGSDKHTHTDRRNSTIKLDAKVQSVRDLRAGRVLKFFAEHFLALARTSNENRSFAQAHSFLLMADNMATLMNENGHSEDARTYKQIVEDLSLASRTGVQDLLGSNWESLGSTPSGYDGIDKQTDVFLLSNGKNISNWETKMKKTDMLLLPPPHPPPESSPIIGLDRMKESVRESGSVKESKGLQGTSLIHFHTNYNSQELLRSMSEDSIDSLSSDSLKKEIRTGESSMMTAVSAPATVCVSPINNNNNDTTTMQNTKVVDSIQESVLKEKDNEINALENKDTNFTVKEKNEKSAIVKNEKKAKVKKLAKGKKVMKKKNKKKAEEKTDNKKTAQEENLKEIIINNIEGESKQMNENEAPQMNESQSKQMNETKQMKESEITTTNKKEKNDTSDDECTQF